MKKGCIFLISARKNILKTCLQYLNVNYNKVFKYPILIFYHGSKYDDLDFQDSIKSINPDVQTTFHKLECKIPDHLQEKDLFYNLDCSYVRKSFPKSREGYLHANHFWNNFMDHPELKQYEYMMRIDDDSWFKAPIDFDFFEELDNQNKLMGTGYHWNHVNDRVIDTRLNFYQWIQHYVQKHNVDVKHQDLKKYLSEGENDVVQERKCNKAFHEMKQMSGNCSIYNRKLFETESWKTYLKEFNDVAGGYRYRWGDCEVQSFYYYMHVGDEFMDLDLRTKNLYHNQIYGQWDCVEDVNFNK